MGDRIAIEGKEGTFNAPISRDRRPCLHNCCCSAGIVRVSIPTSARPATNWLSKGLLWRSRPIFSGVRSRASILASRPRLTGSTGFAFIKLLIVTPA